MDVVIACISRFNPPRCSHCDVNKLAAVVVEVYYFKQIVIRTRTAAISRRNPRCHEYLLCDKSRDLPH